MFAQQPARVLVEHLDVLRDPVARDDAHRFDQLEAEAPGKPGQAVVLLHLDKRLEQRGDLAVDEMLQPTGDLFGHFGARLVVDESLHPRFQRVVALHQLADGMFAPHQPALLGVVELGIGSVVEPVRPQVEFGRQRRDGGGPQGLRLLRRCRFVLLEPEAFETADEFALDRHFTLVVHLGHKALLLLQPAQQHGCAPVNKSLRQSRVKRIRQAIFYRTESRPANGVHPEASHFAVRHMSRSG